jgi:hypothetical protein
MDLARGIAVVLVAFLAGGTVLSRRRFPTVWSTWVIAWIGAATGLLFASSTGLHPIGVAVGCGLALAALVTRRRFPRDFLVLFARRDARARALRALDQLGLSYTQKHDEVSVARPSMRVRMHSVAPNLWWVSIRAAEETPKTRLVADVLRKLLAN